MKIYAILPIKHTSTRVPGKNFRNMNNKPLYYWIINTLLQVRQIDKIIIDTNSSIIKNDLHKYFDLSKIIIYDRPECLWADDVSMNMILKNVISDLNLDADYYLQTHVTNPLLKRETIEKAIGTFINQSNYDSLFSVKVIYSRLYNKDGHEINHNKKILIPTQDLDPIYEENSCIYMFSKECLFANNSRIGNNPILFPMNQIESQDIDWETDFILTEALMRMKLQNNS